MKRYETTTNIAPIVNVDTYGGFFSWESLWESQAYEDRREGYFVCDDYDFTGLKKAIVETANEMFADEKPFEQYGVRSIKAVKMGSPREYNFTTDWLELEVETEDDFIDRAEKVIMSKENEELVTKYIKEHWRTRDGFISSMPAEWYDELPWMFHKLRNDACGIDDMRAFGSVLALLDAIDKKNGDLMDEYEEFYGSLTGELVERFTSSHTMGDFMTVLSQDEAYERFPKLKQLMEALDRAEAADAELLQKFREGGSLMFRDPEAAKAKAEADIGAHRKELGKLREKARGAVENYISCGDDRVNEELDELLAELDEPEEPVHQDLPGQMKLPGLEDLP